MQSVSEIAQAVRLGELKATEVLVSTDDGGAGDE